MEPEKQIPPVVPVTKDQVAQILEQIAQLLELKGEVVFKVRAYQNAARAIETFGGNLREAAEAGRLGEIPGVGKAIAEKVAELVGTGKLGYWDELRSEFPESLFALFDIQGLGPKKIKALYEKLAVDSVASLELALKDGRVEGLSGFGKKTAANLVAALESAKRHASRYRLGDIAGDVQTLLGDLRAHSDVIRVASCGSYRRARETVGDLDFLVSTKPGEAAREVITFFTGHPSVEAVLAKGETKASTRLKSGIQADLRVVRDSEFAFALNYFTGSKEHNIVMRQRALARGWTLNEYRLAVDEQAKVTPQPIPPIFDEKDIYAALGLDEIPPELREDRGEFAAAEDHRLPSLVQLENLRGTFHNHTRASDGRNTLEEMAEAAVELGLQYLGIADHSKSSFQAGGLTEDRLLRQVEAIKALNRGYAARDFRIFAGSEVDVLKDGTLDFADEIMAQLDYVVASVHSSFQLPEAEMTARIIRAMENKYVTMIGHLTGRLLLSRDGYAVDVPAILDAAAATGTWIELNANPRRLDMDWRWWPLAKEKGVICVINPDAHHTSQLQHLKVGIGIARKGWLTRKDVVNCLALGEIETALAAKRGGRSAANLVG